MRKKTERERSQNFIITISNSEAQTEAAECFEKKNAPNSEAQLQKSERERRTKTEI